MPLNHTAALLTLSTPNLDRLVEFYQQLLDQEPVNVLPNIYAEFQLAGVKLGIFRLKDAKEKEEEIRRERQEEEERRTGRRREEVRTGSRQPHPSSHTPTLPHSHAPTGMSLCLEVENLDTAIAHLTQLGYPPVEPVITASHGQEIYAYDPDGNWLILHQSHSLEA